MKKIAVMIVFFLGISSCDIIPRGAGLQSEVLAVRQDGTGQIVPYFAVEIITRANLTTYTVWPKSNANPMHWIDRTDQPQTRTIRSGDTVSITIWSTENDGLLTGAGQRDVTFPDMQVSSSGRIFLPYIGDVQVSGTSPDRARERVQESYESLLSSPQVQLQLREGQQGSVSLIGGVSSPGTYPLPDNNFTLLKLFADSGGIVSGLNNPQVRLQRGSQIYGIGADRLLSSPRFDTTLVGGDKIYVEEDTRTFLSLGAASSEAVHTFDSETMTALEAMSVIGGISDTRADAKGILILRRYPVSQVTANRLGPDHPRTIFTLDLTTADGLFSAGQFLIEPDDLIYVTESPVTAVGTIFALFGSVLGLSNQLQ